MLKRIWLLLALSLVFSGCNTGGLNLNIRYDQIYGLVKGDRVMFEHNPIGVVTDVSYTDDGDYTAAIVIQKKFAKTATEYSRFYITDDPGREGRKAIEMIQARKEGAFLKNHATLEGATRTSVFFEQMSGGFERGFEEIGKSFEQFMEELSQVSESEAFKNLEKQLKDLAGEMNRSGKDAREKIEKEWLPQIEKELENLRKRFREMGREEELKPLEVQFEKIKTAL